MSRTVKLLTVILLVIYGLVCFSCLETALFGKKGKSKLQALREGRIVEDSSGVHVRLNPEKKRLEYSTGRIIDVSNDTDFFPRNEKERILNQQKEYYERNYPIRSWIKNKYKQLESDYMPTSAIIILVIAGVVAAWKFLMFLIYQVVFVVSKAFSDGKRKDSEPN